MNDRVIVPWETAEPRSVLRDDDDAVLPVSNNDPRSWIPIPNSPPAWVVYVRPGSLDHLAWWSENIDYGE